MNTTKQKLIQCAYELFGRNGFNAVGLDQIITDVGVSKQTFYNHFQSKDDLILAVLQFRHTSESEMFDKMLTAVAGRDPRARLYGLIDALEYWFTLPEWKGCIFMRAAAEFPSPHDPAHKVAKEHAEAILEFFRYTATLAGASDPERLSLELALVIEGVIGYHHLTGNDQIMQAARRVSHQLLNAQLPPKQSVASEAVVGVKPAGVEAVEMDGPAVATVS